MNLGNIHSTIRYEELKQIVENKGYAFFNAEWSVNIIGVRNMENLHSNEFNDLVCLAFVVDGQNILFKFKATTDPGVHYRENTLNEKGTAIVVPGQYRGVWKLGLHRGQYEALTQATEIRVYRDNNTDSKLDKDQSSIESGFFGINLHRAGANQASTTVDRHSAGCIVIADPDDYDLFLMCVKRSMKKFGPRVSFTLLESTDLWEDIPEDIF